MTIQSVAVVILNWNGKSWLEKFLPNLVHFLPDYAKLYVADNASTDDSIAFLQNTYPSIQIIQLAQNYGFAKGYNEALKNLHEDVFVLLNSDIEVNSDWIQPVINLMNSNPNIGACQPKILDQKNKHLFEYAGASGGFIDYLGFPYCRGRIFNEIEIDEGQYNDAVPIFWATGACMFVKNNVYWEAGGLDEDYFAHMEEIDLCWRIQKLGYDIYIEPKSFVYHVGGGTLNKYSSKKTYLNFRNNLFTLLKNANYKFFIPTIFYKLILDGIAGIKFLYDGQFKHTWAVVKAHFSVYFNLITILKKRKIIQQKSKIKTPHLIHQNSVVWKHFALGINTFNEIHKN